MQTLALWALALLIIACLSISLILFFNFIYPIFWGAPYAPSNISDINALLDFAQIKPGELAADLGSGDGRTVILMAERGATATGYEISPLLVMWSRIKAKRTGKKVAGKTNFFNQSFWNVNLSKFDVIFLYQLPHVMNKLADKLAMELKPGAKIICNGFSLKTWRPVKTNGRVYMYIKTNQQTNL